MSKLTEMKEWHALQAYFEEAKKTALKKNLSKR